MISNHQSLCARANACVRSPRLQPALVVCARFQTTTSLPSGIEDPVSWRAVPYSTFIRLTRRRSHDKERARIEAPHGNREQPRSCLSWVNIAPPAAFTDSYGAPRSRVPSLLVTRRKMGPLQSNSRCRPCVSCHRPCRYLATTPLSGPLSVPSAQILKYAPRTITCDSSRTGRKASTINSRPRP